MEISILSATISVAAGGAIGSVCRYYTKLGFDRWLASDIPYGTFTANVGGSFVIGILFVVLGGINDETSRYAPLFMTGFLGGYTTFSAFSLDAWVLAQQGRIYESVGYVFGTVALSVIAVFAGIALARQFQT